MQDVQRSVKFYTEVLGMRDETHLRPNLPYDGIALPSSTQPQWQLESPPLASSLPQGSVLK